MEERDGQHMGVVEKALEKWVPPFSMMCRVLFMACIEPVGQKENSTSLICLFSELKGGDEMMISLVTIVKWKNTTAKTKEVN